MWQNVTGIKNIVKQIQGFIRYHLIVIYSPLSEWKHRGIFSDY